jgi:hypothetical protein
MLKILPRRLRKDQLCGCKSRGESLILRLAWRFEGGLDAGWGKHYALARAIETAGLT